MTDKTNTAHPNNNLNLAINLKNVSKQFGKIEAVSGLNLRVPRSQILGFLGPNGAGKTTTIRMLTGFVKPSSGEVFLLGQNMRHQTQALEAQKRLGFVPDVAGLDLGATGRWLLNYLTKLQGQPAIDRSRLIDALELSPRNLQRPMGQLSRGTRQKINIVQGLQHRPDILILDEPTEGLDPLAKRALFGVLRQAQERGATIFFSSHVLSEVEVLCDRVALIRRGQLVAVDEINNLRSTMHRRVTLRVQNNVDVESRLRGLSTISQLTKQDDSWQFYTGNIPALLNLLTELPVEDIAIEPPSLEDVFIRYYQAEEQVNA